MSDLRIVSPEEAQRWVEMAEADPDGWPARVPEENGLTLAHTVATEPDRIRAAMARAWAEGAACRRMEDGSDEPADDNPYADPA